MKGLRSIVAFAVLVGCGFLADDAHGRRDHMLVANRGAGSFSVIDIASKTVATYALPNPGTLPEPMYITHSPRNDLVYIGDRANERLVVYNANDYSKHIGFVPVGAGIFHQWGEPVHNQLWVNNDIDNTISVVNMLTSTVITTIPIAPELASGKPHDVILDPSGGFAYVTILGVDGRDDFVLKYSTASFTELNRLAVGKDPHVFLSQLNDLLYVPTQGGGAVHVVDRTAFTIDTAIAVANSHGAFLSADTATFFTTNIAGGGSGGLVSIDTATNTVNTLTDTPFSGPHNIRLSPDQNELFLTHSGANSQVSVWDITDPARPVFSQFLTTELNPYGIEVVVPEPRTVCLLLAGCLGVVCLTGRLRQTV